MAPRVWAWPRVRAPWAEGFAEVAAVEGGGAGVRRAQAATNPASWATSSDLAAHRKVTPDGPPSASRALC